MASSSIVKVIRMVNHGGAADVTVRLEHGGESVIHIAGEVIEIYHIGKSKSYIIAPWARPKQSRKSGLTDTSITSRMEQEMEDIWVDPVEKLGDLAGDIND